MAASAFLLLRTLPSESINRKIYYARNHARKGGENIDSTPEFDRVIGNIRAMRAKFGCGNLVLVLNRAFTQERMVSDIGTYERMCGVHLSMAQSTLYIRNRISISAGKPPVIISIFCAAQSVSLDGQCVYREDSGSRFSSLNPAENKHKNYSLL